MDVVKWAFSIAATAQAFCLIYLWIRNQTLNDDLKLLTERAERLEADVERRMDAKMRAEDEVREHQKIISALVRQHGAQFGEKSKQLTYRRQGPTGELITETITREASPEIR